MAEEEGPAIELRQRKKPKCSENKESAKEEKINDTPVPERAPKHILFQRFAKIFIGCLAAVTSGMMYALYLSAYHERKFWFSNRQRFCYLLMSASTYTFMMVWEYSHYLLFLQAISLFLLDSFSLEQSDKVHEVYKIYIFSLFLGYLLQFENSALLVSPLLSLVVALMLAKCLQLNVKKGTFVAKIMRVINFYLVCALTVTLTVTMKMFVPHKENGHMLKFLEVKFGLNMTNLKYLWTPYVCMLAAFGVCSPELWMTLFKWLRLRTVHPVLLIYQIYSKRSAEDIYKILTSYKASYLIIEDAICNEVGTTRGCRVKDLLDIANGHVVCEEGDKLTYSKHGRFCHEVKINYSPYVNYFTRVYWNRSYFVYKINTVISFQS
ncbi:hypothetical protein G4228_014359 [Cervus hanglu yarkandensis]|nr:hypothetical protein G4228_014359 [Cervus hanglu yarkandensis]